MVQEANINKINIDFLLGTTISTIAFLIFLNFYTFTLILYLYGFVITGMVSGIIGGICNEDMIRSVLSGVAGVVLGFFLPPFIGLSYLSGASYHFNITGPGVFFYIIMSILLGGLGGLIGNQIRVIVKKNHFVNFIEIFY